MDPVQQKLKALGLDMTRQNYLHLAFFGNPPVDLDAEVEADLPEEFQIEEE